MPFAYRTYQDYEQGRSGHFKTLAECRKFMENFKDTFCRLGVQIHFLGLFDTVNSVSAFELPFRKKTYLPVYAPGATYVRHAVSIDERRLKFKPALLSYDDEEVIENSKLHDMKEVWFAGNHGDVGGGWDTEKETNVQLSDIALEWMLREIEQLPETPAEKLAFNHRHADFLENVKEKRADTIKGGTGHDALSFGKGWGWTSVLFWWIFGSHTLPFSLSLSLSC